jgi:hypothetical protein
MKVAHLSNFTIIFAAWKEKCIEHQLMIRFIFRSTQERRKKWIMCLNIFVPKKNVTSKFVKSLVNTEFYEMRISVDNEYRIILFTIDSDNFITANEIVLLNGFIKKSTADYDKQIAIALKLMEDFL